VEWVPLLAPQPRLGIVRVTSRGRTYELPYLSRPGSGPALLFVHGLGGAKENFLWATQSRALAHCELLMFDMPGTGLARFRPDDGLDVSALADLTQLVANQLMRGSYFLAGASMGGLVSLLQIRRHGIDRIRGVINIEGNLASEDCMFSRRVVAHSLEAFRDRVFEEMMHELRRSAYAGDRLVAHHMALNVDVRAYHAYSFQTVAESDSGVLLEEFVELPVPRLFLYGDANRHLPYLHRLWCSDVRVVEVPDSAHFLFYDNPVATFQAIGGFVDEVTGNSMNRVEALVAALDRNRTARKHAQV
jgi:pimeloyl-ACP methyl ester carboxylesterase